MHLAVLLHLVGNGVAGLELIDELLALVIEKETTDTTESLSSQELHLSIGVIGVNETSRVHLNLLQINTVRINGHSKLLSVTSAVVAVGDWETPELRSVLLEEGVPTLSEVYSETGRRNDEWTMDNKALSVKAYPTPTPASLPL